MTEKQRNQGATVNGLSGGDSAVTSAEIQGAVNASVPEVEEKQPVVEESDTLKAIRFACERVQARHDENTSDAKIRNVLTHLNAALAWLLKAEKR